MLIENVVPPIRGTWPLVAFSYLPNLDVVSKLDFGGIGIHPGAFAF